MSKGVGADLMAPRGVSYGTHGCSGAACSGEEMDPSACSDVKRDPSACSGAKGDPSACSGAKGDPCSAMANCGLNVRRIRLRSTWCRQTCHSAGTLLRPIHRYMSAWPKVSTRRHMSVDTSMHRCRGGATRVSAFGSLSGSPSLAFSLEMGGTHLYTGAVAVPRARDAQPVDACVHMPAHATLLVYACFYMHVHIHVCT